MRMSTSPSPGSGVGLSVNSKLSRLGVPSGRLFSRIWRWTLPAIDILLQGSSLPEQPRGTDQIHDADREDDRAGPLPVAVIGHALDDEGGERGARDGECREIADAGERAEIERTHDVTEGLRDRLGGVGGLAVKLALLEENIEK